MSSITEEMRAEFDRIVNELTPGMVLAAKKLKRFYDVLSATELPEDVIMAAITAWCQGESRLSVEPMLHQLYVQQHQAQEVFA